MEALRRRFPWLREGDEVWLRLELLRRAAVGYEQVGQWREAAECWAEMGQLGRAGQLYARSGDLGLAAQTFLVARRYAEGLALYQAWEERLSSGDVVQRVRAVLGQAACHFLGAGEGAGLSVGAGREQYQRARVLMEQAVIANRPSPIQIARCWVALGEYGELVGRCDLVEAGYEGALRWYAGTAVAEEKVAAGRAYLAALRGWGDRSLLLSVEERLAEGIEELPLIEPRLEDQVSAEDD